MIPTVFWPEKIQSQLKAQGLRIPEPKPLEILSDDQAMRLAIQEAYRGLGAVSPNPLVGCVILDSQNRFLTKGYHAKYGEAHAEVNALRLLDSEQLKDAKVFVTLEPCAHEGKTPSCAKALAKLPVKEVIYGLVDPNPLVSGQGAQILEAAGIKTRRFEGLQAELEAVCEHFLWNFREKKVFVTAKVASSLDGQMALMSGESKWITDETSREVAHVIRAAHDAILVGANTVLTDNPSLNIRSSHFSKKQNKLVILDQEGLCLTKAASLQLAQIHDPQHVYFVVSEKLQNLANPWGAQVIRLPETAGGLDLGRLLGELWSFGMRSVMIEGGAKVLSSFISEKKVQRLYLFQAPLIMGAKSGRGWTEGVKIESMSDRIPLQNRQYIPLAQDLLITGTLY